MVWCMMIPFMLLYFYAGEYLVRFFLDAPSVDAVGTGDYVNALAFVFEKCFHCRCVLWKLPAVLPFPAGSLLSRFPDYSMPLLKTIP